MTAAPAIECHGVDKRFGAVTALDGLDLHVAAGSVVGFLGPNGAGKSTTIRILVDLVRADAGDVRVLGADPRTAGPGLRRRIGYLPGELRLDDRLDVETTLRSWGRLRGGADDGVVADLCDRLVLDRGREVRGLSTGNRRKLGLVGAFLGRPELLVLDEPTAGVDPFVQEAFAALVREAADRGATVFLSSHVLSEVQRVASEVVVIKEGRAIASGTIDELRGRARQPFVARFAGDPPVDALRSAPGVDEVVAHRREVQGVVLGSPDGLLGVLAAHHVEHLLLPEPDLEDAFLRLYDEGGR